MGLFWHENPALKSWEHRSALPGALRAGLSYELTGPYPVLWVHDIFGFFATHESPSVYLDAGCPYGSQRISKKSIV